MNVQSQLWKVQNQLGYGIIFICILDKWWYRDTCISTQQFLTMDKCVTDTEWMGYEYVELLVIHWIHQNLEVILITLSRAIHESVYK